MNTFASPNSDVHTDPGVVDNKTPIEQTKPRINFKSFIRSDVDRFKSNQVAPVTEKEQENLIPPKIDLESPKISTPNT